MDELQEQKTVKLANFQYVAKSATFLSLIISQPPVKENNKYRAAFPSSIQTAKSLYKRK